MLMYLSSAAGFALLLGGGEFLVRGAVTVSRRLGLTPLLIGMTVVAWCTSAPELVVSMGAALEGRSDIAVGNVVGSNIFNVLAVLGVAALITPILVSPKAVRRDMVVMLASAVAVVALSATGEIGRPAGAVLLLGVAAYVGYSYRLEVRKPSLPSAVMHEHESQELKATGPAWSGVAYMGAGLLSLVVGSRFLIDGASEIARTFGVPEAVIGLSLVAVGTSLPELATSVVAAVRGHLDVAVGNVVGSNIFNALGILGLTALVQPIGIADRISSFDVLVMVGASAVLAVLLLWKGRIGRPVAALLVIAYIGYLLALF